MKSQVDALACHQREHEPLGADALSGEPSLDVAGLVAAQRRLLAMLEAQLNQLERAGG